jgi:phage shock protein A
MWLERILIKFYALFRKVDPQEHLLEQQCEILLAQAMQAHKDYAQCVATEASLRAQLDNRKKQAAVCERKAAAAKNTRDSEKFVQRRDQYLEAAKHLTTKLEELAEKTARRKERMEELVQQAYTKKQIRLAYMKEHLLGNDHWSASMIRVCIAALVIGFILAVCYTIWF